MARLSKIQMVSPFVRGPTGCRAPRWPARTSREAAIDPALILPRLPVICWLLLADAPGVASHIDVVAHALACSRLNTKLTNYWLWGVSEPPPALQATPILARVQSRTRQKVSSGRDKQAQRGTRTHSLKIDFSANRTSRSTEVEVLRATIAPAGLCSLSAGDVDR